MAKLAYRGVAVWIVGVGLSWACGGETAKEGRSEPAAGEATTPEAGALAAGGTASQQPDSGVGGSASTEAGGESGDASESDDSRVEESSESSSGGSDQASAGAAGAEPARGGAAGAEPASGGAAGGEPARGGAAGGEPASGGAAGGDEPSGAGGAGDLETAKPTLVVLEPLPALFAPADLDPTEVRGSLSLHVASADGSVLSGTSGYWYEGIEFDPGVVNTQAVAWTEETGVVGLGTLDGIDPRNVRPILVSADGSAVFGDYNVPTPSTGPGSLGGTRFGGFFRWTQADSMTQVGETDYVEAQLSRVSADGKTLLGWITTESLSFAPFRWTEAEGVQRLTDIQGWPEDSSVTEMSADGSVLLVNGEAEGRRVWRWTVASGLEDLGRLPDSDSCQGAQMTADGSVVIGHCYNGSSAESEWFRWTPETGMVPWEFPRVDAYLSDDGTAALGFGAGGLTTWEEASAPRTVEAPQIARSDYRLTGVSSDAGVAGGHLVPMDSRYPDEEFPGRVSDPGTQAFRWSEETGWLLSGTLDDHEATVLKGFSQDGSLAVGYGRLGLGPSGEMIAEAVLWDGQVLRSIPDELERAGVDLSGLKLEVATRVWSGTPIVVQGVGTAGEQSIAWIVELP